MFIPGIGDVDNNGSLDRLRLTAKKNFLHPKAIGKILYYIHLPTMMVITIKIIRHETATPTMIPMTLDFVLPGDRSLS